MPGARSTQLVQGFYAMQQPFPYLALINEKKLGAIAVHMSIIYLKLATHKYRANRYSAELHFLPSFLAAAACVFVLELGASVSLRTARGLENTSFSSSCCFLGGIERTNRACNNNLNRSNFVTVVIGNSFQTQLTRSALALASTSSQHEA
jgi:hypothetical protein